MCFGPELLLGVALQVGSSILQNKAENKRRDAVTEANRVAAEGRRAAAERADAVRKENQDKSLSLVRDNAEGAGFEGREEKRIGSIENINQQLQPDLSPGLGYVPTSSGAPGRVKSEFANRIVQTLDEGKENAKNAATLLSHGDVQTGINADITQLGSETTRLADITSGYGSNVLPISLAKTDAAQAEDLNLASQEGRNLDIFGDIAGAAGQAVFLNSLYPGGSAAPAGTTAKGPGGTFNKTPNPGYKGSYGYYGGSAYPV